MKNYLNFENEIKNLENEIEKLKDPYNQEGLSEVDTQKISSTQAELDEKLKDIYSNLDPWQTTMVARHEDRPKSKFFIDNLFEDFISVSYTHLRAHETVLDLVCRLLLDLFLQLQLLGMLREYL